MFEVAVENKMLFIKINIQVSKTKSKIIHDLSTNKNYFFSEETPILREKKAIHCHLFNSIAPFYLLYWVC